MDRSGVFMWMTEDDVLDYVRDTHQGSLLGPLVAWRALYRYYARRSAETGIPIEFNFRAWASSWVFYKSLEDAVDYDPLDLEDGNIPFILVEDDSGKVVGYLLPRRVE